MKTPFTQITLIALATVAMFLTAGATAADAAKDTSGAPAHDLPQPDQEPAQIADPNAEDTVLIDEMHMVGIYEPANLRLRDGRMVRAVVPVIINRPNKTVVLVLGSYDPVRWLLRTANGTEIARVILAGPGAIRSEAILNGEHRDVERTDMPSSFKRDDARFQPFHDAAAKAAGVTNADSFVGAYEAPETGFLVDSAPGVPTSDQIWKKLLAEARDRTTLPPRLQAALSGERSDTEFEWVFNRSGFEGTNAAGETVRYDVPLELPEISWPSAVAYDPVRKRLWGVTYGGEGYLYEYDISRESWSARTMKNIDAKGLLFDPASGHLIASVGVVRSEGFMIYDTMAQAVASVRLTQDDYPGLTDILAPSQGDRPIMVPIAIEGDEMLVTAQARFWRMNGRATAAVYLVNLRDGSVDVVR